MVTNTQRVRAAGPNIVQAAGLGLTAAGLYLLAPWVGLVLGGLGLVLAGVGMEVRARPRGEDGSA